ncbi:GNAT family N-acetyltransferase [Gottschalkiaceae bacterium SANA]|nr:GNAT family N-acetyltransferase [Gottschalkiaceae bacterium SANA]
MIRVMQKKDYEQAILLWNKIEGMGLRKLDDSYEGIERFLDRNPKTCFVVEEEKQVVATILCGHDGRRALIYHLAVTKERRGRGYGKALVRAVENAVKEEGIHKIALLVFKDNRHGNDFWTLLGYQIRKDLNYRNKSLAVSEEG